MSRVVLFTAQDVGYQLVKLLAPRYRLFVISYQTYRDRKYGYRSAIQAARESNVCDIVDTTSFDDLLIHKIKRFRPEILVGAYYAKKIPQTVLDLAPVKVNIHPGILPYYRGRFPTPWYILNGAKEFGLAIHEIDGGIDTGGVYFQATFPMPQDITGFEFYRLTQTYAAGLIDENLDLILSKTIKPEPQIGVGSYYSSIEPTWHVDWNRSVAEIERRVRVHAKPYNQVTGEIEGQTYKINKAVPISIPGYTAQGGGKVIENRNDGTLIISCCDGCLHVIEYEQVKILDGKF